MTPNLKDRVVLKTLYGNLEGIICGKSYGVKRYDVKTKDGIIANQPIESIELCAL